MGFPKIGEGPGEVPQYGNINGVFHYRNRSVRLRRRPCAQMVPGRCPGRARGVHDARAAVVVVVVVVTVPGSFPLPVPPTF